jgi:hypothetical protein
VRMEKLSLSTRRALGMEPPEHGRDSSLAIQRVNKIFWRKEGPTCRGGKESPHIFRVKCARRLAGVAKGFLSPR